MGWWVAVDLLKPCTLLLWTYCYNNKKLTKENVNSNIR